MIYYVLKTYNFYNKHSKLVNQTNVHNTSNYMHGYGLKLHTYKQELHMYTNTYYIRRCAEKKLPYLAPTSCTLNFVYAFLVIRIQATLTLSKPHSTHAFFTAYFHLLLINPHHEKYLHGMNACKTLEFVPLCDSLHANIDTICPKLFFHM